MAGPVFFLSAAEHSGDVLGAALIGALRRRHPYAVFLGLGGPQMQAAGCTLIAEPVHKAAMGPGAIIRLGRYWWRLLKLVAATLRSRHVDVVVPIDSSSANLRVAAVAHKLGIPVCYYVAPQLWASRPWRIRKIRRVVNTLCCVLPFEEAYFQKRRVHAVYVGHPMFDQPGRTPESDPALLEPKLPGLAEAPGEIQAGGSGRILGPGAAPRIAILPGSRRVEVSSNMPPMLEVLAKVRETYGTAYAVAVLPSPERAQQAQDLRAAAGNPPLDIRIGSTAAVIRWADVVLVKSGTAVLEVARLHKPLVVMYAIPRWKWNILRWLVTTRRYTLPNILAGRNIYREFIPFYGSSAPVAQEMLRLLADPAARDQLARDLAAVVAPLGPSGPDQLAADRVAAQASALVKPARPA